MQAKNTPAPVKVCPWSAVEAKCMFFSYSFKNEENSTAYIYYLVLTAGWLLSLRNSGLY